MNSHVVLIMRNNMFNRSRSPSRRILNSLVNAQPEALQASWWF